MSVTKLIIVKLFIGTDTPMHQQSIEFMHDGVGG